MAQSLTKNMLGYVDKRRVPADAANRVTTDANFSDITSMRTRLFAVSATAYSVANLDKMTVNDMLYALRLADEAAGI